MTEKDADEDKLNLFADIADGKPDMTATVTRQEMATLIYRAMRYIEQHSKYTYTDYNSNLAAYTDSPQLKEWAKEPMAFMEALELIDPVTKTTLAPFLGRSDSLALHKRIQDAYESTSLTGIILNIEQLEARQRQTMSRCSPKSGCSKLSCLEYVS